MSPETLFAVGTLAYWVGFVLVLTGSSSLIRTWLSGVKGLESWSAGAWVSALGIAGVVAGHFATRPDKPGEAALSIPILWPVMPHWYWAIAILAFGSGVRLVQTLLAVSVEERRAKLIQAAAWALTAAAVLAAGRKWGSIEFSTLRGAVPLTLGNLLALAILAIISVVAMIGVSRTSSAGGRAKSLATHFALLCGSVVFGIPFAFLVITSFKEDRDMSSAEGIIWVPRVQQTVPYFDKNSPYFEADLNGMHVEGVIINELPGDRVVLDVAKPFSIRGTTGIVPRSQINEIPRQAPLVSFAHQGTTLEGKAIENLDDGRLRVEATTAGSFKGTIFTLTPDKTEPIRSIGLRWQNYAEALSFMPPETVFGLVYLRNTLILVLLNVLGTLFTSALAAYAFSRLKFPGKEALFSLMLATLMLPGAVTLLPQFLIFKQLGWIDSLKPLWVPAFFGSAFNIFLLRQFFSGIPMELEDAAKIDGCSFFRSFWSVLIPQVKPALAVISIWTILGAWNNFMGPLIYVNSPEQMPLTYALQLFQSDRMGEPGLLMAFATMSMVPVLALFFFAQRYFIEGVSLSGLGGR